MQPWTVSREFYDWIMDLPDGTDVTDHFDNPDEEWKITNITLYKTEDGGAILSVNALLAMEIAQIEEDK